MEKPDKLCVIWTSADPEVAMNMALMYAKNSRLKGWWGTVRLIVWGPSQKTLMADAALQKEILECAKAGVELWACRACADRYGLAARLEGLGLDVIYVGDPLTRMLKDDWSVVTA